MELGLVNLDSESVQRSKRKWDSSSITVKSQIWQNLNSLGISALLPFSISKFLVLYLNFDTGYLVFNFFIDERYWESSNLGLPSLNEQSVFPDTILLLEYCRNGSFKVLLIYFLFSLFILVGLLTNTFWEFHMKYWPGW